LPPAQATRAYRARRPVGLLRHLFDLVPTDKDQLWAVHVVPFEGVAVPGRRLCSRRKRRSRHIVQRATRSGTRAGCRRAAIPIRENRIAITLPKPRVIRAMLRHHRKIDVRAEVELPHEPLAAEPLVRHSRTTQRYLALGEIVSRRLSDHGVEPDPLHSQLARIKRLASGKE